MGNAISIKHDLIDQIEHAMQVQNINTYQLHKLTGLNSGTITHIFNRTRALTIKNLIAIIPALDLDRKIFFEQYAFYCSDNDQDAQAGSWRTVKDFLKTCLENDYESEIEIVLKNLNRYSEKNWSHHFLTLTEEFWGKCNEDILSKMYQHIIRIAPFNHKVLSVSYYRLFLLAQQINLRSANEVMVHFKAHLEDLPQNMRLNALLRVATHYFKVKQWDEMERYSDRLIEVAKKMLDLNKSNEIEDEYDELLERKLVKFYGQGYLLKSSANRNRGAETNNMSDLKVALDLISCYEDLSWFPDLDDESLIEVERFKLFAEGNTYHTQLLMGNSDVIHDNLIYLEKIIEEHQTEKLPGFVIIIECANRFHFEVPEHVIKKSFELILEYEAIANHHLYYEKGKQDYEFIQLTHELAKYLVRHDRDSEGFESALHCLELSYKIRNDRSVVDSIGIIEGIKNLIDQEQINKYHLILEGLGKNEKRN